MGEKERETASCEALVYKNLEVSFKGGRVDLLINRPRTLNNLSVETLRELVSFFESLLYDREKKVVVVRGAGDKAFIAGADIKELYSFDFFDSLWFCDLGHKLFNLMESVPQIIVAVIDGYCMGGGFDFAMACDLRIGTPRAKIAHTAAKMGLITGFGGTQRLPRLVGLRRAKEIFFKADVMEAKEALEKGILADVVDERVLSEFLDKLCRRLCEFNWGRLSLLKSLCRRALDLNFGAYSVYEIYTTFTRCCYGPSGSAS